MRNKLTLLLVCSLMAMSSFAQTSGECGENLTWNFDSESGTLTISGTGEMIDYSDFASRQSAPWFSHGNSIKKITIQDGVTTIGNWAFAGCYGLLSVTIPNSIISFGNYAFYSCEELTTVTIPSSVINIGRAAFSSCTGLTSITVRWEDPSIVNYGAFIFSSVEVEKCTLNIPKGTLDIYQESSIWEAFILNETDGSSIENAQTNNMQVQMNQDIGCVIISNAAGYNLSVTDIQGRMIYTQRNLSNVENISTGNWVKGFYIFFLEKQGSNTIVKKIIR